MCEISDLRSITGSRARAGILAVLLGEKRGARPVAELAEAAGVRWSAADREVRRLVAAGVLRRHLSSSRAQGPLYEADPSLPGVLELRRFVLLTVGDAARIREALASPARTELAWIHGRYAEAVLPIGPIRLVVITPDVRETRERVATVDRELHHPLQADVMSFGEWLARLEKREMRVLAIRRAPRLWLLGNDHVLRDRERMEARGRAARKQAIADWREEAEWDDDFDPFAFRQVERSS